MPKKLLLSDTPAKILIAVNDQPGVTTKQLVEKLNSKRPPTIYAILSSLADKGLFIMEEKHNGTRADGRPSFSYQLSPKGKKCAELYRTLFKIEENL